MIITLEGTQGCGKTLTATTFCYTEFINRQMLITAFDNSKEGMEDNELVALMQETYGLDEAKALGIISSAQREVYIGTTKLEPIRVYANNHLNFPYQYFDAKYFLEHLNDEELVNSVLLLDEAYIYLDARTGASKLNKLFTYFIVQTRKRGVDLYICTHHVDIVDKRLRRAIDVRGTCRYKKEAPCQQCQGAGRLLEPIGTTKKKSSNGNGHKPRPKASRFVGESKMPRKLPSVKTGLQGVKDKDFVKEVPGVPPESTVEPETCPRCLGYGVTGWETCRLLDLRTGVRKRVRIFGPAVYHLYSTEEMIPLTKKQTNIKAEDL